MIQLKTCLIALLLACAGARAQSQPAVRFTPVDPAGPCIVSYIQLNTNTGTVSTCKNNFWTVTRAGDGVPETADLPAQCTYTSVPTLVLVTGGSARPALYACTPQNTWAPVGPDLYRADTYPSLQAAIDAAGSEAEVLLPDGYTAPLRSELNLSGHDVTLHCAPGATIAKAFAGDAIHITGSNIAIDGCRIEGPGLPGGLVRLNDAHGVLIRKSTLTGSGGIAVAIYTSADVTVSQSTFTQNGGSPIFAQDRIEHLEIANNTIDSSNLVSPHSIDTIGVHTWMPGGTVSDISIHDNTIVHGGDNFAVEVGAFSEHAIAPVRVSVDRNNIRMTRDSNGGVSYSTVNHGSVSGNHFDAGGHAMYIDAIELAAANHITVDSNTLIHTRPNTTYTVALNGSSNDLVRNNVFEGGIYIGTSRTNFPAVDGNLISGNSLTASGAPLPRGIVWFQCNTRNCSVSRNQVTGNVLHGNNSGSAINFENDYPGSGVMDANQASTNQVAGASQGVSVGNGATNTTVH
jgi:hypothetical protein